MSQTGSWALTGWPSAPGDVGSGSVRWELVALASARRYSVRPVTQKMWAAQDPPEHGHLDRLTGAVVMP